MESFITIVIIINSVYHNLTIMNPLIGEHQYELMDSVAAKFHEEPGVFKLMVCAYGILKFLDRLQALNSFGISIS